MKKALFLVLLTFLTANITFAADMSQIAQNYYNKALNCYKGGNIPAAKEYFKKVIKMEPSCTDAYYNMGVIMENEQKMEGAVYYYENAARLNPADNEVKYRLGLCLNNIKRYDEAISYLSTIPMSAPSYKNARALLNQISPEGYPIKPQKNVP